ncbi:MAG: TrmB family transcriptional regulator, partial [Candidatus Woesearchaeota archaeon]
GKPIKYIAVPPKEVLERVKKNIKQESQTQISSIDKLKDSEVLNELDSIHKQGITFFDPVEMSGSLKDKDSVYAQMATMIKGAEKEVILITTDEHIEEKLQYLKKYLQDAKKRGVDIKIAAPTNTKKIKEIEEIATVKQINMDARFCIVDRESVLFLLTKGTKHQDPGIWVNTPIFSETLVKLFELSWQTTQPLKN